MSNIKRTESLLCDIATYGKGVFIKGMFENKDSVNYWLKKHSSFVKKNTFDVGKRNGGSAPHSIYILDSKFWKNYKLKGQGTKSIQYATLMDLLLVNCFMFEMNCLRKYSKPFKEVFTVGDNVYAFFTMQYGMPKVEEYDILVSFADILTPLMSENQSLIFKSKEKFVPKLIQDFKH